jgi:hypothetical protein
MAAQSAAQQLAESKYDKIVNLIAVMNTEANQLNNADQLALQSCMKKMHLIFYPDVTNPSSGTSAGTMPEGSNLTIAEAATRGYGLYNYFVVAANRSKNSPLPSTQESTYEASLTKKEQSHYDLVENGPSKDRLNFNVPGIGEFSGPKKGCVASADEEAYGSVENAALVPNAPARVFAEWTMQVSSDPRVNSLFAKWSTCMKSKGSNFSSPVNAYQTLQSAYEKEGPTPILRSKELKTALNDVGCENVKHWKSKLQGYESSDAGAILQTESGFILHTQERNKKLLAELSHSGG